MNYLMIIFILCLNIIYSEASEEVNLSQDGTNVKGKYSAYDESITEIQVKKFLTKLKLNISENNIDNLSNMFQYPFNCNSCKKPKIINSKVQFKKRHKEIITKSVIEAINKTNLNEIFVNYQGFMIENGKVWFDPLKGIKAIN